MDKIKYFYYKYCPYFVAFINQFKLFKSLIKAGYGSRIAFNFKGSYLTHLNLSKQEFFLRMYQNKTISNSQKQDLYKDIFKGN